MLGATSTVAGERKGDCGPDIQEELAVSVWVVDRVRLERAAQWECFFKFLGRLSLIFYAVGIRVSPVSTETLLGLGLQLASIWQCS